MSPVAVNGHGAGDGSAGSAPASAILQRLYSAPDAVACNEAAAELANFIQSNGLRSLEEAEISADLVRASKNAKSGYEREGAMVAIEEICRRVGSGKGAEPYLLPLLPHILERYTEQGKAEVVKDAAVKAGKQLVQLPPAEYIPKFIDALFDVMEQSSVKWKTKVGAIDLLATLPARAKDQVAERLGEYIPRLETQMRDTKADVSNAAIKCAEKVCGVLSNPDAIPFIPILVNCMARPDQTGEGVKKLSANVWVRDVDGPTLAILVPLLARALNERSTTVQRQAIILISNLFKLVRSPILAAQYAPILLPGVTKIAEGAAFPEIREFGNEAKKSCEDSMEGADIMQKKENETNAAGAEDEKLALSELSKLVAKHNGGIKPDVFMQVSLQYIAFAIAALVKRRDFDEPTWRNTYVGPYLDRFLDKSSVDGIVHETVKYWLDVDKTRNARDADEDDDGQGELITNLEFSLAYGGLLLLNHTTLKLRRGHRYGVCGANGAGKSTLLKAINRHQIDNWPEHLTTFYVEHDIDGAEDESTCIQFLNNDKHIKAKGATPADVQRVLKECGFDEARQNIPVPSLSGGWKMRLALARAMVCKADLLLLDEPTNHLDRASITWLEGYLNAQTETTVLVVSHDSGFLDNICTDIMHYEKKRLVYYRGNLQKFVEKHPAAKSYYTLSASVVAFSFPPPGSLMGVRSSTRAILKLTDCTFTYPNAPKPSLYNASCAVTLSSRVGVVGPNGAGKSTLIKLLTGDTIPDTGKVEKHPNLRVAYVAQHAFAHLEQHMEKTACQYIQWRYQDGHDRELTQKATRVLSEEDKKLLATPIEAKTGEKRYIEQLIGRQKLKKSYSYEVKWKNLEHRDNVWVPRERLIELGFSKLVQQFDDFEASREGSGSRELSQKLVRQALEELGLDGDIAQYNEIKGLSGGQKVKVVLASALWSKPQLLILDEPTNFLDRDALGGLAVAIKNWAGAFVCISHNEEFVGALCPEIWNVDAGHLTHKGKAAIVEDAFDDSKPIPALESAG